MYAVIKMAASASLDNITLPFISDEMLNVPVLSKVEQKVACVVAGYCTAILAVTDSIMGRGAAEAVQGILHIFAVTIIDPLAAYVTEERKKNDLGG
jgi:hypothetical protein